MAFGRGPLSHPLLTDAIENAFVPLAVNNRPGTDGGLLERYEEPQYNNPVVRYFAPDGDELLKRKDRVWTSAETVDRMVGALRAGDYEVPGYLRIAQAELSTKLHERAVFGMHCFWQGQAAFGRLDGVLEAKPGWMDGGEVVEVRFDPRVIDFETLVRTAQKSECARRVFVEDAALPEARRLVGDAADRIEGATRDAKPSDDLYHLNRSPLRYLPLTRLQALRINGDLEARGSGERWLSPSQTELLSAIRSAPKDRLDGLRRPEELGELAAYEKRLRARLDG